MTKYQEHFINAKVIKDQNGYLTFGTPCRKRAARPSPFGRIFLYQKAFFAILGLVGPNGGQY